MKQIIMGSHIEVESSHIQSIAHSSEHSVLEIIFKSGGVYRYHPFTEEAFREFLKAKSFGGYFHQNIIRNPRIEFFKL